MEAQTAGEVEARLSSLGFTSIAVRTLDPSAAGWGALRRALEMGMAPLAAFVAATGDLFTSAEAASLGAP